MLTNEVVLSIIVLLSLSLLRINVVISLIISALTAGLLGNMGLEKTIQTFTSGLGGGAEIAMNYAVLGAFAVAIMRSGITDILSLRIIEKLGKTPDAQRLKKFRNIIFATLLAFAISSQNLLPVHIAFIPIVVPPLLEIFNKLNIDRRAVACVLTFGLTATYMILPVGFGKIFIESVLVDNINKAGADLGLKTSVAQVSFAMLIPVVGMILGLLAAVFLTYRKPRIYKESEKKADTKDIEERIRKISPFRAATTATAVITAFAIQLFTNSTIVGALMGLFIFCIGGVFKPNQSSDVLQEGLRIMAMIGFVMIAASGYATVIKATGGVNELVNSFAITLGDNKSLASFLMLLVGLLITMGIGSSFSTVPIISSIYVPLCISLGFSTTATVCIVGVAAALGDAGSPASDSTLAPTAGLNIDGQHDHIWDSVVPTFIHYNIPLIMFGWLASMLL